MINVSLFTVRPRSCGKVMFSIASVSSHGFGGGMPGPRSLLGVGWISLVHAWYTPSESTPPRRYSLGRYTPSEGTPLQKVIPWSWHLVVTTEADSNHYTGMLSCELNYENNHWRIYPKGCCEETTSPAFCKKNFHFHKENGKIWLSSPPLEICMANPGVAFWLAQYTPTPLLANM